MKVDLIAKLAALHLGIPDLRILVTAEWAGAHVGSRALLRQCLAEATGDVSVLDLARVPDPAAHSVSISHDRERGGYVIAPGHGHGLGLDLEIASRVRSDLVERVTADERELSDAPAPAALWCAKEASFKALYGVGQPRTVSEIRVAAWERIDASSFGCVARVKGQVVARGVVSIEGEYVAAIFAAMAGRPLA